MVLASRRPGGNLRPPADTRPERAGPPRAARSSAGRARAHVMGREEPAARAGHLGKGCGVPAGRLELTRKDRGRQGRCGARLGGASLEVVLHGWLWGAFPP